MLDTNGTKAADTCFGVPTYSRSSVRIKALVCYKKSSIHYQID